MNKQSLAGLVVLALAGSASAQDPVGNFFSGLDGALINLDTTLVSLSNGNSGATASNLNTTVGDLTTTLARDTAAEPLAAMGEDLGNQVVAAGDPAYPLIDELTAPGVQLLSPVLSVYQSGLLANGLPLVDPDGDLQFTSDSGLVGALPLPVQQFADVLGPGGQVSTALGDVLAGGAPAADGLPMLPLPGLGDGGESGSPGLGMLMALIPTGDGAMALPLPLDALDPSLLTGLLPTDALGGGDLGSGMLFALIPGGDGETMALPLGALDPSLLTGLLPGEGLSADGLPLPTDAFSPDALTGLLQGLTLDGLGGA